MANLEFPTNPSTGDVVTLTNGVSYTWTGSYWSGSTHDPYVKKAGDTMTGNLTIPSLNNGQLAGFRNIIINGTVTINQRGKTYAQVANNEYWADRWKKVSGGMTQIIESGNFEPSAVYTLSGTGITTQQITSPSSGDWTLPDISTSASKIQLELGSVATPFESRPIGLELSLCQRYYYQMNSSGLSDNHYAVGYTQSANVANFVLYYPTAMRTTPTAAAFGSSWYVGYNADSEVNSFSFGFFGSQTTFISIRAVTLGSMPINAGAVLVSKDGANGKMAFDAEL